MSKESVLLSEWQKFCARLAAVVGCMAMDEEVERGVKRIKKERSAAFKIIREYQSTGINHSLCGNGHELCSICRKADRLMEHGL